MLILEGPDGAGKTSLAQEFSDYFDLPIAPKVVGSDTKPMVDIRDWTNNNLAAGWQDMIFDRHRLISEPIYSVAMGGDRDYNFWEPAWLGAAIRQFQEIRPVVVWCITDFKEVNHNVLHDRNNEAVWLHIEKIYRGYLAAWLQNTYKYQIVWDYKKTDPQWLRDRVHAMLLHRKTH